MTNLGTVTHLISDEGIAAVLLGCVVFLGFIYFWKQINRKTTQELSCEQNKRQLEEIVKRLQGLKEDFIEVKIMITGRFRNIGETHDD